MNVGRAASRYRSILRTNSLEVQKTLAKRFYDENKLGPGILIGGIVALCAVSLVFYVAVPVIIQVAVTNELQLKNGTEVWKLWESPPVPIYWKIMFFNITNPHAVEDGEKFKLQEVGPYVIEEKRTKNVLNVNEEEDTVTYSETLHFFLRPELSTGSFEDRINIPNIPYICATTVVKKYLFDASIIMPGLFGESFVSENLKVEDLMFRGVEVNPLYSFFVQISPMGNISELSENKFALLKGKNGSTTGVWTVNRGIKDPSQIGSIVTWNGKSELPYWTNKSLPAGEPQYCNMINGSDGSLSPAFPNKETPLNFFHPMAGRTIKLRYTQDTQTFGMKSYQYRFTPDVLASPAKNPDNQCFWPKHGSGLRDDYFEGGFRLFPVYYDAPVAITKPHFLDSEQRFVDGVEGMKPNREAHDGIFEIEKNFGVFLKASIKAQVNVEFQPLPEVPHFQNIPYTMLPILWLDLAVELDDHNKDYLKSRVLLPLKIVAIIKWLTIGATLIFILMGLFLTIRRTLKNRRAKEIVQVNRADAERLAPAV